MSSFWINLGVTLMVVVGIISWWNEPEPTEDDRAAAKAKEDEEWARSPFNRISPYYRNKEERYK